MPWSDLSEVTAALTRLIERNIDLVLIPVLGVMIGIMRITAVIDRSAGCRNQIINSALAHFTWKRTSAGDVFGHRDEHCTIE